MSSEKKSKPTTSAKLKKVKLVRDSFCMPKDEYAEIETLKQRALTLGKAVKKSELLRAGVLALSRASDADLLGYIAAVPNLKTGRPATNPAPAETTDQPAATVTAPARRRKPATPVAPSAPSEPAVVVKPRRTPAAKRASARKTTPVTPAAPSA